MLRAIKKFFVQYNSHGVESKKDKSWCISSWRKIVDVNPEKTMQKVVQFFK